MKRLTLLIVAFFAISTQGSAFAQRLHAILVADTDSTLGEFVPIDIKNMEETLRDGLGNRLTTIHLTGSSVTAENIVSTLSELQIEEDDAVLLYYAGHGGYDSRKGHYLYLTHGNRFNERRLYRSRIISSMTNPFTPRFWAVVTDCCASISQAAAAPMLVREKGGTLLRHLFLETDGRLDITAARPEQVAVFCPGLGGVFTSSFCSVLRANSHRQLRWDDVFRLARSQTGDFSSTPLRNLEGGRHYHNGVEQETQTPYSFRTMYGNCVNGLRLGISHTNLVITSVNRNCPAAAAGFRRGMRVVAVNGKQVVSDAQLVTAVNFSHRAATIDVTDNGVPRRFNIRLAY